MSANDVWVKVNEANLIQGDYLERCLIPVFDTDFLPVNDASDIDRQALAEKTYTASLDEYDVIIMTQSCDLQKPGVGMVAVCPISKTGEFERVNPKFTQKGKWDEVKRARHVGLYWLPPPTSPANAEDGLVVDFRQIYSLPYTYLSRHAQARGERSRQRSPFREDFSQRFGLYFMRVGLP